MWNRKNDNIFWRDKCTYVISKGPVRQFPGFLVCLVNTVVTFSIYKNAHPSNFKRPVGRGIERESHMLEYISTHAHCTLFSHKKKQWSDTGPSWPSCSQNATQGIVTLILMASTTLPNTEKKTTTNHSKQMIIGLWLWLSWQRDCFWYQKYEVWFLSFAKSYTEHVYC